ncbi:hypothetical protein AGOR_G00219200 [Albula goreensis]|uniref:Uncharacterized protein n=1 Tax=Albula goreensis TaxID=1534307 RepID=A0A8T3CNA9_9TELE|nr:hypothetical protein AGOR_G00219200 [Albula goreensis]
MVLREKFRVGRRLPATGRTCEGIYKSLYVNRCHLSEWQLHWTAKLRLKALSLLRYPFDTCAPLWKKSKRQS